MTDEEIIKRAKDAEKRTGFGELVHSPASNGVNSAYGIGFIEGMVEYRNSLQEEPTIPDIVDEHFHEMLGEEPINNGLDLGCGVIWKDEEPVSEDLEKAAKHYLYSNILYDDVYVGNPTDKDCIEMFKAGANWKEQQLMAKAIDAKARFTMSVPSICISLPLGVNVGDKVKVIVIKED